MVKHTGNLKPTWRRGETTVIRVPVAMKSRLIRIARALDYLDSDGVVVDAECYEKAVEYLTFALKLPPNKGGRIKDHIRAALALLEP